MGSSCSSLLKRRSGDSETDASEYLRYGLPIQRVSESYLSSEYPSLRARAPALCRSGGSKCSSHMSQRSNIILTT
jgi:hypothetical protein